MNASERGSDRLFRGLVALHLLFTAAGQADDAAPIVSLECLVEQLADPSYHQRERAAEHLLAAGVDAVPALQRGQASTDLEVRRQCLRILSEVQTRRTTRELDALLSHYDRDHRYELLGWIPFRAACGDDLASRSMFKRVFTHEPAFLCWLQRISDDANYSIEDQLEDQSRFLSPDSRLLNTGDPITWSMLLLAASHPKISQFPLLGSAIHSGLQTQSTVRQLTENAYQTAIKRLIENWIRRQSQAKATQSLIRIATLYQCDSLATDLAARALTEGPTTPATVQFALLTMAAKSGPEARQYLVSYLADQRVCQIWRIVAGRRRAIQTEVRDTALALLMYLHGRDPRDIGYRNLEADPRTIFREQTLGFETPQQRALAHQMGAAILASIDDQEAIRKGG